MRVTRRILKAFATVTDMKVGKLGDNWASDTRVYTRTCTPYVIIHCHIHTGTLVVSDICQRKNRVLQSIIDFWLHEVSIDLEITLRVTSRFSVNHIFHCRVLQQRVAFTFCSKWNLTNVQDLGWTKSSLLRCSSARVLNITYEDDKWGRVQDVQDCSPWSSFFPLSTDSTYLLVPRRFTESHTQWHTDTHTHWNVELVTCIFFQGLYLSSVVYLRLWGWKKIGRKRNIYIFFDLSVWLYLWPSMTDGEFFQNKSVLISRSRHSSFETW